MRHHGTLPRDHCHHSIAIAVIFAALTTRWALLPAVSRTNDVCPLVHVQQCPWSRGPHGHATYHADPLHTSGCVANELDRLSLRSSFGDDGLIRSEKRNRHGLAGSA